VRSIAHPHGSKVQDIKAGTPPSASKMPTFSELQNVLGFPEYFSEAERYGTLPRSSENEVQALQFKESLAARGGAAKAGEDGLRFGREASTLGSPDVASTEQGSAATWAAGGVSGPGSAAGMAEFAGAAAAGATEGASDFEGASPQESQAQKRKDASSAAEDAESGVQNSSEGVSDGGLQGRQEGNEGRAVEASSQKADSAGDGEDGTGKHRTGAAESSVHPPRPSGGETHLSGEVCVWFFHACGIGALPSVRITDNIMYHRCESGGERYID
jgi:hypothetical protein